MLTFMTAALASGTALWIAYGVYPIQKKKDRELKLQEEKAAVYRAFFDAVTAYYEAVSWGLRQGSLGHLGAEYETLLKAQTALMLYAPGNVVSESKACTAAMFEYWAQVRIEQGNPPPPSQKLKSSSRGNAYYRARDARDEALVAVRVDLWNCTDDEARKAVAGLDPSEDKATPSSSALHS